MRLPSVGEASNRPTCAPAACTSDSSPSHSSGIRHLRCCRPRPHRLSGWELGVITRQLRPRCARCRKLCADRLTTERRSSHAVVAPPRLVCRARSPLKAMSDSATSVDAHQYVPPVGRCYAASGGKGVRVCLSACRYALAERPRGLEPPCLHASSIHTDCEPSTPARASATMHVDFDVE